jgi:hypothetical protein
MADISSAFSWSLEGEAGRKLPDVTRQEDRRLALLLGRRGRLARLLGRLRPLASLRDVGSGRVVAAWGKGVRHRGDDRQRGEDESRCCGHRCDYFLVHWDPSKLAVASCPGDQPGRDYMILLRTRLRTISRILYLQELGTFAREGLTRVVVVVVVNNDGYAVERAIHDRDAYYNNIVAWRWQDLPKALGANNVLAYRAQTCGELQDALRAAAATRDRMNLIEAVLPRLDVPPLLTELAEGAATANASQFPTARSC